MSIQEKVLVRKRQIEPDTRRDGAINICHIWGITLLYEVAWVYHSLHRFNLQSKTLTKVKRIMFQQNED